MNVLYKGDCLKMMKRIAAKSVDMVLADLPYGQTSCEWDSIIDLEKLWVEYKRIIKENGVICLFGTQPFTTRLISSNLDWFKYCWYLEKNRPTGFVNSRKQPLRCIEEICMFYKLQPKYFPQNLLINPHLEKNSRTTGGESLRTDIDKSKFKGGLRTSGKLVTSMFSNYPQNLIIEASPKSRIHPTQKPVGLLKYLIRTYTEENDLILDNVMGSGSTGVACKELGRNFSGCEISPEYCAIAEQRLKNTMTSLF